MQQFKIGDQVDKLGGDYTFSGVVVAAFTKLSGLVRYVVENEHGILHIFSGKNLIHAEKGSYLPSSEVQS